MPTYLEQWNDVSIPLDTDFNWDNYAQEQQHRLTRLACIFDHMVGFKRRMGADATREDLAIDQKMAKRMRSAAYQFAGQWGATDEEIDAYGTEHYEALRREAAQVDWPKFIEEHRTYLQQNLRLVATTALRKGDIKIGNKLCNRLLNEVNVAGNAWSRAQNVRAAPAPKASKKSSKTPKKS